MPLVLGQYWYSSIPTQYQCQYVLVKINIDILFLPNIVIIECTSCACAVPVSLTCCQFFGMKTYSCVTLFCVCYRASLIPIPPTTQYRQYEIHSNQYAKCSIIPALNAIISLSSPFTPCPSLLSFPSPSFSLSLPLPLSPLQCFIYHIDQGLRSGGGIGERNIRTLVVSFS